jgi:16S rRNA (adenine1518-N6/adenine1519-N6)-dimethyltransferase
VLGALTEALLTEEATIYATEQDPRLFPFFRERFSENARLNVQFGDAVKHPLANLPKNVENFKIVANLPYSIASVWLEHVLALDVLPRSMVLMVQKEAGERWIAQAGTKKFSQSRFLSNQVMILFQNSLSHKNLFVDDLKLIPG